MAVFFYISKIISQAREALFLGQIQSVGCMFDTRVPDLRLTLLDRDSF